VPIIDVDYVREPAQPLFDLPHRCHGDLIEEDEAGHVPVVFGVDGCVLAEVGPAFHEVVRHTIDDGRVQMQVSSSLAKGKLETEKMLDLRIAAQEAIVGHQDAGIMTEVTQGCG
jgi:hypothetical protein